MNTIRRIGSIALVAAFGSASAFCAPVITFGFDSSTGLNTVTQTSTLGDTPLNVNAPASLFTFSNFAQLGIANAVYAVGDSSFDYQFTNKVTSFAITNNDTVTDNVSAQLFSNVDQDPGTTMPTPTIPATKNDRKNAGQDLGFGYSGNNPNTQVLTLANTGSIFINAGATYNFPGIPVTYTAGIGINACGGTTFGDTLVGDGCALALKQDATYSGLGFFSYGLTDNGSFGFSGLGATGNPHLSFAATTTYSGKSEVTYEYSVVVPSGTPEPTTMILFGSGLIGLGLLRKRIKS